MNKLEMIRFLEPFNDDVEIVVTTGTQFIVKPSSLEYKPVNSDIGKPLINMVLSGWTLSPVTSDLKPYKGEEDNG